MDMKQRIEKFVEGAQKVVNNNYAKNFPNLVPDVLVVSYGKKYARVTCKRTLADQHGSAWAFIDLSTGLLYKPASWKVPAKGSRGNVNTDTFGVEFVDAYGPSYSDRYLGIKR